MAQKLNQGNTRYFQEINTNTKAYYLGFIAADGCIQQITSSSMGLSITLNIKDKMILDKLKEEIGCEHRIYTFSRPQTFNPNVISNFCRFQLCNKELVEDIQKYGITKRKSLTIGNIIKNIPKEHRKSFILGYFDGDGSVILGKGQMLFSKRRQEYYQVKTKRIQIIIRGTKEFLEGIPDEIGLIQYSIKKYDSTYKLTFSLKSEVLKFFSIYKNNSIYLKRKYDRFLERLEI